MYLTDADITRFWQKVDKSGDCWLWTSAKRTGYGIFGVTHDGKRRMLSAHRISYFLANEFIDNRQVCHSCDTPACVNPDHLFLGTSQDNNTDKHNKGRGNFPLTNEQVMDIRSRELSPTMCRELAEEFNSNFSTIKNVLTGKQYSWLPGEREIPEQFTGRTLTPEQVEEIRQASLNPKWGWQAKLARKFGVGRATINHVYKERLAYSRISED